MNMNDYGAEPAVLNMECMAEKNTNFRTALWTGKHLQVTLMCIPVGGEIGKEMHSNLDQFIRIESGSACVMMGKCECDLNHRHNVNENCAVIVPAGTWHNIVNTGNAPLKVCSIYAPPQHPYGTIHLTKEDAEHAENHCDCR